MSVSNSNSKGIRVIQFENNHIVIIDQTITGIYHIICISKDRVSTVNINNLNYDTYIDDLIKVSGAIKSCTFLDSLK